MFNYGHTHTPASEDRKREFIQSHNIQKNITAPTLRFKAKRLLEIPEQDDMRGLAFDHLEFFRAADGTLIGVTSPYGSRSTQGSDLERLGWTRCEGLYTSREDSFVKTLPPGTEISDVVHRRLASIIELNFERDPTSFVSERDLSEWFHNHGESAKLWKKVLGVESFDKFKQRIDHHLGHFRTRKSVETELFGAPVTPGRERCWIGWKFKSAVPLLDETSSILAHI